MITILFLFNIVSSHQRRIIGRGSKGGTIEKFFFSYGEGM